MGDRPGSPGAALLGAGIGITDYRLSGYVQRFPGPDDPQGSLRRGPSGEVPFTALPGGSGRNFTWMLTAGVAVADSPSIRLDPSYRYTDAGEIRTDAGDIAIVRYREDGARREIPVRINETFADYRIHSLLVVLRFGVWLDKQRSRLGEKLTYVVRSVTGITQVPGGRTGEEPR